MKIVRILVYKVELPYKAVSRLSQNRDSLDSTIVAIETDDGITGYGESCPVGAVYLEAFAETARAAIDLMSPPLLGCDPRQLGRVNALMDDTVLGHAHAKSPLDIACWDILGQAAGLPVHTLLGGRFHAEAPLVIIIPIGQPEAMVKAVRQRRKEGFRTFQMKVGTGVVDDVARIKAVAKDVRADERLIVDANRGWTTEDAFRVLRAIDDVDCVIEQPCSTYQECLTVRRRSRHPFLLDEIIGGAGDLIRAFSDGALDSLVIKLSHAGGLTRAAQMRDICVRLGLRMRIEDTAGSEFVLAATAHLAHATPPGLLIGAYPFVNEGISTASGGPEISNGRIRISDRPGLGLTPHVEVLGKPVREFS